MGYRPAATPSAYARSPSFNAMVAFPAASSPTSKPSTVWGFPSNVTLSNAPVTVTSKGAGVMVRVPNSVVTS